MTAQGQAALWLLLSAAAATALALLVRVLTPDIPVLQITFIRCALGAALLLPLVFAQGLPQLVSRHWPLHLLRGGLAWLAIAGSFYAFSLLPLVAAMALLCTTPLFVTVLNGFWLHEAVSWPRWAATLLGGIGALIVLVETLPLGLLALGSALLLAITLLLSRRLAATESPATLLFYFALVSSLLSLPPAWLVWQGPDATGWLLLVLIAGLAALRSVCEWRGYRLSDAATVAPVAYLRVVLVGVAAWLLLAELPTAAVGLGAVLIIAASVYSSRHPPS